MTNKYHCVVIPALCSVIPSEEVMESWDEAYEEELLKSQEDADLVDEAHESRTPSDSESETGPTDLWWVQVSKQLVHGMHYQWPVKSRSVRVSQKPLCVMSACSGCSAESEVMKAGVRIFQL